MKTLIRGGRLVLGDRIQTGDLLVDGERVAALGSFDDGLVNDERNAASGTLGSITPDVVFDARGCYVLPGFIDVHTHLDDRIGRFELADTYASGTEVAVLNGITTLFAFITQGAKESLTTACERALAKAEGQLHADMGWHLTPTRLDEPGWREIDAWIERGFRTFKFYTTYRSAGIYASYEQLEDIFSRLAGRVTRVLIHGEDDALLAANAEATHLDLSKAITHAHLRLEAAEILATGSAIHLGQQHEIPLHLVHVSTLAAASSIAAMRDVMDVSCETCPQYLWLDEECLNRPNGHRWICSPPLRKDRERFRDLARTGTFDCFATDHCAFRRQDKDDWDGKDIRTVANGLPGIGALPHLIYALFEEDTDHAMLELARTLSANPARLMGLERKGRLEVGRDADLVILDPRGAERPIRSSLADVHEPYPEFTTHLGIRRVYLRGRAVVADGALLDTASRPGQKLMGT